MFKLEITNIHDFLLFVNIIRGKDLDAEEVARLTAQLNKSSDNLQKAVNNATTQEEKKDA
jgi:hypothetical protein